MKNSITDITEIASLSRLETLTLDENQISDVSALQDLTMLREIQLQRNQITDITPLVNNTGLNSGDRIYLHGNPINADVRSTQIPALESLDVIVQYDFFVDSALETAVRNQISKPTGDLLLSDLYSISFLEARDAGISDLTGMHYCSNIITLDLDSNSVSDISELSGISALNELRIENNRIVDLDSLQGLGSLSHLYLSGNRIEDLSPLSANTGGIGSGDIIYLYDNPLSAVAVDSQIPTLEGRGVQVYYQIFPDANLETEVRAALGNPSGALTTSQLATLTSLSADGQGINNLTGLQLCSNITSLELAHNFFFDLSPLRNLSNLTEVIVTCNSRMDLSGLVENASFASGDVLVLYNSGALPFEAVYFQVPALLDKGVTVYPTSIQEPQILYFNFDVTSINEGAGTVTGTIRLSNRALEPLTVQLNSSHPDKIASGSVIIPAGSNSATFTLQVVDNRITDGDFSVTVDATLYDLKAYVFITVEDEEDRSIVLTFPEAFSESDGLLENAGTVELMTSYQYDVSVELTNPVPDRITVPASVLIPAGTFTATFDVELIDDQIYNPLKTNIYAQYPAYPDRDYAFFKIMDDQNGRLYVDDYVFSSAESGLNWADALSSLRTALELTKSGDVVWIAEGVYTYPGAGRTSSFKVNEGVSLYGGFNGTEADLSERVITDHDSVISGEAGIAGDSSDNLYHVLTPGDRVLLDGLVISGGNANHPSDSIYQGGAAFYLSASSIELKNCRIEYNESEEGAITAKNAVQLSMEDCSVSNNYGERNAGVKIQNTTGILKRCIFANNITPKTSGTFGAALNTSSSPLSVDECVFTGNVAYSGGAIYINTSSPTFRNCIFCENEGTYGGAINFELYTVNLPELNHCLIQGNTAEGYGGAFLNSRALKIADCIISENSAPTDPNFSGSPSLIVTSSLIEGCGGSGAGWDTSFGTDGGGNIDGVPTFVDSTSVTGADGVWLTEDDGLQLARTSLGIDAGISSQVAADILGISRPQGTGFDMGPYEFINYSPTAEDLTVFMVEDGIYQSTLPVNDNNNDALTFTVISAPAKGEIVIDDTSAGFTYTPYADQNGSDNFSYEVTDDQSVPVSASVSISISAVNDAPTASGIADQTIARIGGVITIDLYAVFDDVETPDSELAYEITGNSNPQVLSNFDISSGILSISGSGSQFGDTVVTIKCSDAENINSETSFTVSVQESAEGQAVEFGIFAEPLISDALSISSSPM